MKMVDGHTCLDTYKACLHIGPDNWNHTICTEVGITNHSGTAMEQKIIIEKWRQIFLNTKTVSMQPLEQLR